MRKSSEVSRRTRTAPNVNSSHNVSLDRHWDSLDEYCGHKTLESPEGARVRQVFPSQRPDRFSRLQIRCDLTLKPIHLEAGVDTLAYGEADHLEQALVCDTLENQEGKKANHRSTRVDLQG